MYDLYTHENVDICEWPLKAIDEIRNSILCFIAVLKRQLQPEVTYHCLFTVQTVLNFSASSFCCKIKLI